MISLWVSSGSGARVIHLQTIVRQFWTPNWRSCCWTVCEKNVRIRGQYVDYLQPVADTGVLIPFHHWTALEQYVNSHKQSSSYVNYLMTVHTYPWVSLAHAGSVEVSSNVFGLLNDLLNDLSSASMSNLYTVHKLDVDNPGVSSHSSHTLLVSPTPTSRRMQDNTLNSPVPSPDCLRSTCNLAVDYGGK